MKSTLFITLLLISNLCYSDESVIENSFSKGNVDLSNSINISKTYNEFKFLQPYIQDVGAPLIDFSREFTVLETFDIENYKIIVTEYVKKVYNVTSEVEYVKKLNNLPDIDSIDNNVKFELWTDMGKNEEIFSSTEVYKSSCLDRFDKVNENSYVVNLFLFPKKYDCKNKKWVEIDKIDVNISYNKKISLEGKNAWNGYYLDKKDDDTIIKEEGQKFFNLLEGEKSGVINKPYNDIKELLNSPLLILTPNILISQVDRLAQHKQNTMGRITYVKTVEEIENEFEGEDIYIKIRNCIKDYYDNHGVIYVILCGDWGIFPVRYNLPTSISEDYLSNMYYPLDAYFFNFENWDSDGNGKIGEYYDIHMIPDVIGGRIPVRDLVEASNYVDKVINFETNPKTYAPRDKILTNASILYRDWDAGFFYEDGLKKYCSSVNYQSFYEYQSFYYVDNIFDVLNNNTPTIFFHTGHSGWSTMRIMDGQQTSRTREPLLISDPSIPSGTPDIYLPDPARGNDQIISSHWAYKSKNTKYYAILSGGCSANSWDKNNPIWKRPGDGMLEMALKIPNGGAIVAMGCTRSPSIYSTGVIISYMRYMFLEGVNNFAMAFYLARNSDDYMYSLPIDRIKFEFLGDPTLVGFNSTGTGPGVEDEINVEDVSLYAIISLIIAGLVWLVRKLFKLWS